METGNLLENTSELFLAAKIGRSKNFSDSESHFKFELFKI